jgi:hypothetical protein
MTANPASQLGDTLGLAHGQRAAWIGLPTALGILTIARRFARSELVMRGRDLSPGPFDMIHIFTMSHGVLEAELPEARKRLAPSGTIWVSWPSPEARLPSDMSRAGIERLAREMRLGPADPCALTPRWSALPLALPDA